MAQHYEDKDTPYFPHFCNARHDRRIRRVRRELGVEGYGIFFMLLETLREQTDYKYPLEDIDLLADEFGISEQKIQTVISNYGLFQQDNNKHFFSSNLIVYLQPYFDTKEKRKIGGLKGNLIKYNYAKREDVNSMSKDEILQLARKSGFNIDNFSHISLTDSDTDQLPARSTSDTFAKERKESEGKERKLINKSNDDIFSKPLKSIFDEDYPDHDDQPDPEHFQIAFEFYKAYSEKTAITMQPSEKEYKIASDLFKKLPDVGFILDLIPIFFDDSNNFWFNENKAYHFKSFATNIQDVISKLNENKSYEDNGESVEEIKF
jgi:hypothetical protein